MRTTLTVVLAVGFVSASAFAWSAHQARPAGAPVDANATINVEEVLKAVRHDLQSTRANIIAQNVALTSEQAAKFWPVFEKYQKEQNAIMDAQMKGLQQYVSKFETMDDAGALALMKAHLDRDRAMAALRQTYLAEFQKVLPAKLAVRVLQIDRRLSLAHQMEFAAQIPLAE